MKKILLSNAAGDLSLAECRAPVRLDELTPGSGPWEVEIGFGKGRYLLHRAAAEPETRFLGIEIAARYHGILMHRARRRGVDNLAALRGEALYLLSTVLPSGFARAVHVYFPDPWPKSRHHKRRLFDPQTVDLVLGLLAPCGRLFFATDFLGYGEEVRKILAGVPGLELEVRDRCWEDGSRTNYEAKYEEEGRPILRLEAGFGRGAGVPAFHAAGELGVVSAWRRPS